MTQQEFLTTLFDAADEVCFAQTPYDTTRTFLNLNYHFDTPFFCINALVGPRSDANVRKHRTFLVEFDSIPLEQQEAAMILPYSAKVFSGNKSYHYFISLETPVSAQEYAEIAQRIHLTLPLADKSTKNPSRLGRLALGFREITNGSSIRQDLMSLGPRLHNAKLLRLLPPLPAQKYEQQPEERQQFVSTVIIAAKHAPDEVMVQMHIIGRNNFFHWFGQRLIEAKLPRAKRSEYVDEAYANLHNKELFSLREARMAARV